jgi:hypothetical protein
MLHSNKRPAQSQKEHTSLLQYHGNAIAFQQINGSLMVNATQMAKPFGKRTRDWLRLDQAQDLIQTVSEAHMCASTDLQYVKRGGQNQGTWFQEDVALFFAQWLSPKFYLMCNRKLKELISEQARLNSAPEKFGITGIINKGNAVFPFTEACKVLGKVKYPKASKRKARHPEQFIKLYGRNFITEQYLNLLKGYYDYKNANNQLKMNLC